MKKSFFKLFKNSTGSGNSKAILPIIFGLLGILVVVFLFPLAFLGGLSLMGFPVVISMKSWFGAVVTILVLVFFFNLNKKSQ